MDTDKFFLPSNFSKTNSSCQRFLKGQNLLAKTNSSSYSHDTFTTHNTLKYTSQSTALHIRFLVKLFLSCQTIFLDDVSQCKYRVLNLPIFKAKLSRCYILILKNRVENDSKNIPTWNIITILTMVDISGG